MPQTIKISEIRVDDRQRKDKDSADFQRHVEGLARSIMNVGLIHPITLNEEDNSLIAGECRLEAFKHLGLDNIPFQYRKDLTPLQKKRMELEENLHRLDLTWWEKDAAIAELHELQREIAKEEGEEEEWSVRKTAEMVGASVGKVHNALTTHKEIQAKPELKNEKTQNSAIGKIKTEKKMEERKRLLEKKAGGKIKTFPAEIIVGDARELIQQEDDESFDAIVTNFPFGVEYGYSGKADKVYDDEEDYIVDLVRDVVREGYRVLRPDSWFVGFFDIRKITYSNPARAFAKSFLKDKDPAVREAAAKSLGLTYWLEEAGFSYVNVMPCIWAKPNKRQGNVGDPSKGLVVAYEAFVFAAKGDAMLMKRGRQNLFVYDTLGVNERDFEMQMPNDLCLDVVQMVTMGGARILDPFAGVGSFGEAALDHQCQFRGYELNPKRADDGNTRLKEHVFAKVETTQDGEAAA
jgi:DNA modification methylase